MLVVFKTLAMCPTHSGARPIRLGLLVVLMLLGLAACYRGPGTDDPAAPEINTLPVGVLPSGFTGIFETYPSANGCCWVGPDVKFQTRVAPNADALHVRVAVPDVAGLDAKRQTMTVQVDNAGVHTFGALGVGVTDVKVPIHAIAQARVVTVTMKMTSVFQPPNDGRVLSLFLVRVW